MCDELASAVQTLKGEFGEVMVRVIETATIRTRGEITWISADCSRQFELKRVIQAGKPYRRGEPADERARVERRS